MSWAVWLGGACRWGGWAGCGVWVGGVWNIEEWDVLYGWVGIWGWWIGDGVLLGGVLVGYGWAGCGWGLSLSEVWNMREGVGNSVGMGFR